MIARADVLASLLYPFTTSASPHIEEVQDYSMFWAHSHGLLSTPAVYRRCAVARFGALAARSAPMLDLVPLRIAAAWCTWFTLYDDLYDDVPLDSTANLLRNWHARMLEVLAGAPMQSSDGPLISGLVELRTWTRAYGDAHTFERYVSHLNDYFRAGLWEAMNRAAQRVPSPSEYLEMRPFTGGLYAYIDLLCMLAPLDGNRTMRNHPVVRKLTEQAILVISLSNDLMSLERELQYGEVHNLVIVLERHGSLDFENAWQQTLDMHNQTMRDFVLLAGEFVNDTSASDQAERRAYVGMLRAMVRGSFDWACETRRHLLEAVARERGA